MRNFKVQLLLLVALLVTAATVSAFTIFKAKEAKSTPSTWVFTGNETEIMTVAKWQHTETLPGDCDEVGDSPCSISVQANDDGELATFFSDKDANDILALSPARRP